MIHNDTIAAVATGQGGALAVIRVSGPESVSLCDAIFTPATGGKLADSAGYTLHYGTITGDGQTVDDVMVSLYRAPRSYTGEDTVEISCHGSRYVQREIMRLLISGGARQAEAGEFTVRAFLAGKLDLSQAEAVADIISSESRAELTMARTQMRGRYSEDLAQLRSQLLELVSLLELELDFGEEDVEFADRSRLSGLVDSIARHTGELISTFGLGNAIKEGVAVAIAGAPNAGKSTLLNALLREQRAMVSDIPGTTRDTVEESMDVGGIRCRFIDTAGLRDTEDALERMGIDRAKDSISKADVVLYVTESRLYEGDARYGAKKHVGGEDERMPIAIPSDDIASLGLRADQRLFVIVNKIDKLPASRYYVFVDGGGRPIIADDGVHAVADKNKPTNCDAGLTTPHASCGNGITPYAIIPLSAKTGAGVENLRKAISESLDYDRALRGEAIVSNARHYEALLRLSESLSRARDGITREIPSDLIAQDIRESLHYLGTIIGEITTDDLLGEIFSKFCIGK